jgi:PKD repeat protein
VRSRQILFLSPLAFCVISLLLCPNAAAQINIDIVPNKTKDVAPFKLFVDASGTTAAGVEDAWAFHDLHYVWDFGDPSSGTWATNGKSRNNGFGATYGHVFERPGRYTVTLTVSNPLTGDTATDSFSITVEDPDKCFAGENTICVSTNGNFSGAPDGALLVTDSGFANAIDTYAKSGKRVLFRRGEQWHVRRSPGRIVEDGPAMIGAFGKDAKPKLVAEVGCGAILSFSESKRNVTKNWRVMDLEIDGSWVETASAIRLGGHDQLAYRVDCHRVNGGISFGESALRFQWDKGDRPLLNSDLGIVDCTVSNIGKPSPGGGVGIYGATDGILLLGTTLHDNTRGEHNVRFTYAFKGMIAHNNISQPAWTKQCLTIRSLAYDQEGSLTFNKFTGKLIVADNHFRADNTTIMTNSGFGNNGYDKPKTCDVIWERNLFETDGRTSGPFSLDGHRSTIRNNVFLAHNRVSYGFGVGNLFKNTEDATDAKIYNNTFYTQSSHAVAIRDNCLGVEIYNNLLISADADSGTMVQLYDGNSDVKQSHNVVTSQPGTVSSTYASPEDFRLTAPSRLIRAGRDVPNAVDFAGNPRVIGSVSVGAFEPRR